MRKSKKQFYSHLVNHEPLKLELEELELEKEERDELEDMIDANLHHAILEAVLDELPEEDKQIFLGHVSHDAHEEVMAHLRTRIEGIEVKIKNTADTMIAELYNDIKQVKAEEELES